jgi:GNAT superfamily N-acetyltransferase
VARSASQPCNIEPLGKRHDRKAFSCGNEPLDRYLKQQASQDARRHVAALFVAVPKEGGKTILGYYTLSAFAIDLGTLPRSTAKKLPHYPLVPATLLGRLAVDLGHKGKGLGAFLLMDALHLAYRQSLQIASAAFVVHAINDDAFRFYRHFDFTPFPERRDQLFLPMATVALLFADPAPRGV